MRSSSPFRATPAFSSSAKRAIPSRRSPQAPFVHSPAPGDSSSSPLPTASMHPPPDLPFPVSKGSTSCNPTQAARRSSASTPCPPSFSCPTPRPCPDPTSHSFAEASPVATACSLPPARFRERSSRADSSSSSRTPRALKTHRTSGAAPRPLARRSCRPILRSGCRPPKLPILRPS